MPTYLYHAAPWKNPKGVMVAKAIAGNDGSGLKPLSGKEGDKYLCMSEKESGAVTLNPRANDIIFRVLFSSLNEDNWKKIGAGKGEWRGEGVSIPRNLLFYRRKLGTKAQTSWKSALLFPLETPP